MIWLLNRLHLLQNFLSLELNGVMAPELVASPSKPLSLELNGVMAPELVASPSKPFESGTV